MCKRTKTRDGNIHARCASASDFGDDFDLAIAVNAGELKLTGPLNAGSKGS